jgi:hypothetical protein
MGLRYSKMYRPTSLQLTPSAHVFLSFTSAAIGRFIRFIINWNKRTIITVCSTNSLFPAEPRPCLETCLHISTREVDLPPLYSRQLSLQASSSLRYLMPYRVRLQGWHTRMTGLHNRGREGGGGNAWMSKEKRQVN